MIDYVRAHADRFGVEPILAVLNQHGIGIAPSTFYADAARGFGPTGTELEDAYLADELFAACGCATGASMGGASSGGRRGALVSRSAATRSNG